MYYVICGFMAIGLASHESAIYMEALEEGEGFLEVRATYSSSLEV